MKIAFKNLCDDITLSLIIDNHESVIESSGLHEIEIEEKDVVFSVRCNRDFRIETGADYKKDKVFGWITESLADFIVQIENTYRVSNLIDGDIIELAERAHYVSTTKREAFYKCVPALYYFARAECNDALVEIVSSVSLNRDGFIKFYKRLLRLFNLSGWFRILKYKKQLKRQKRISSEETLTNTFKSLYELSFDEREYQFKPLLVIADRIIDSMLSKLPKKLRAKAKEKIEKIKLSLLG